MAIKSLIITGLTLPLKPTASSSSSGTSSSLCLVKKPLTSSFFNGGCTLPLAFLISILMGNCRLVKKSLTSSFFNGGDTLPLAFFLLCIVKKLLISSFFNGGVAALKISSIRTLPGRSHCHRQGSGALGTRMNLFDRFATSYANALLSSFEDPEKILDQAVLEMNDDMLKMRQATAQVLASQKRLENKYKAAQLPSEDWYRKAQLTLQKGEDLAHEALKRRKSYTLLESKILEAKSKKEPLKARAQSARTATKVNEMVGNVNTSSALAAFEKTEEKVLAMESKTEALGQLTTDDLDEKFALLESTTVDDDLASLKQELSGS